MTVPGSNPPRTTAPSFDRLARAYRWMEYLSFGRALEHCRFHFLDRLGDRRRALALGDGDGRFTARLLAHYPAIRAHAIDGSAAMLEALRRRALAADAADRLTLELADLRNWSMRGWSRNLRNPAGASRNQTGDLPHAGTDEAAGAATGRAAAAPDLIVTHFFLDCLTTDEVAALASRLRDLSASGVLWLISEFAVPARGWMRPLAAALVAALYRAFRLLTGLGPQQLPDYPAAMTRAGWQRIERCEHLCGLLTSELWATARSSRALTAPRGGCGVRDARGLQR